MGIPVIWLLFAISCGVVAEQKNRSYFNWFIISSITGIFGLIVLLITPTLSREVTNV
jgi:hypothetical protein